MRTAEISREARDGFFLRVSEIFGVSSSTDLFASARQGREGR
jgi:hypothetical protein